MQPAPDDQEEEAPAGVLAAALLVVTMVPSAVMRFGGTSSFAAGCVISVPLLVCLWALLPYRPRFATIAGRITLPLALFATLTGIHAVVASTEVSVFDVGRCAGSMAALALVFLGAAILDSTIVCSASTARRALGVTFVTLVVVGVIGSIGVALGDGERKPVLMFAEPSHFALSFEFIFVPVLVLSRGSRRLFVAIAALALAIGLQSMTLLVVVILALFVISPSRGLLAAAAAAAVAIASGTADYFVARLATPSESTNLSTLVWLQGWENAAILFRNTHGIGVGFQQLGLVPVVTGDATDTILSILGDYLNQMDGSFVASKVISEFGVLGLLATAGFCVAFFRAARKLRSWARAQADSLDTASVIRMSAVTIFAVDMFVRGVGYFSAGSFFVSAALLGSVSNRNDADAPIAASNVQIER